MKNNNTKRTKKIIVIGLFSGLAIVFSVFRIVIPGVCKISFDGPFYKFISIVFGSFYGCISAFLAETIGALINQRGGYIPLFFLTAALRGFLAGAIWDFFNKILDLKNKIFKLSITLLISDLFVCFLNSLIIRFYLCQTKKIFLYKLFIRFGKEFLLIIINVVVLALMLSVYDKIIKK